MTFLELRFNSIEVKRYTLMEFFFELPEKNFFRTQQS